MSGAQPLSNFIALIDELLPAGQRFEARNPSDSRGYYEAVVLQTGLARVK